MKFQYQVRDPLGKMHEGNLEANSEEDAPTAQAYTISYAWTDDDEFAHAVGELNEVAAAAVVLPSLTMTPYRPA